MMWNRVLRSICGVALGLGLGLAVTAVAGESPWTVLSVLARSAFGSADDLAMTLFYAMPLVFTGLSVALAFHAGLFNIGAEGQLTFGALAAAAVGALWPGLPAPWAPIVGTLAAFAGGALWGFVPGWLRARRGSHEVITTIMLNFVAAGLASWLTLYVLRNTGTQNPETMPIGPGYLLNRLPGAGDAPLTSAFFLALVCAAMVWVFLRKTPLGFRVRATGDNEHAAETAGIETGRMRMLAMTLSGGLAGLVGVGEVLGNAGKFRLGFSADFGFTGIAVALLARNSPLGVVFAALLFGALHKGSGDLDFETEHVTRELALVFQALVILAVVVEGLWDRVLPVVRAGRPRGARTARDREISP